MWPRSRPTARRCGRGGWSASAFVRGGCAPAPTAICWSPLRSAAGWSLDPDGPNAADAVLERRAPTRCSRASAATERCAGRRAGGGPGAEQGADFTAARDGTTWAVGTYYGPAAFGDGSAFGAGAAARLDSGTDGGSFLLRLLAPAP